MKFLYKIMLFLSIIPCVIDVFASGVPQETMQFALLAANLQAIKRSTPPQYLKDLIEERKEQLLALPDGFEGVLETLPGFYIMKIDKMDLVVKICMKKIELENKSIRTLVIPAIYRSFVGEKNIVFVEEASGECIDSLAPQEEIDLKTMGYRDFDTSKLKRDTKSGKIIVPLA